MYYLLKTGKIIDSDSDDRKWILKPNKRLTYIKECEDKYKMQAYPSVVVKTDDNILGMIAENDIVVYLESDKEVASLVEKKTEYFIKVYRNLLSKNMNNIIRIYKLNKKGDYILSWVKK